MGWAFRSARGVTGFSSSSRFRANAILSMSDANRYQNTKNSWTSVCEGASYCAVGSESMSGEW